MNWDETLLVLLGVALVAGPLVIAAGLLFLIAWRSGDRGFVVFVFAMASVMAVGFYLLHTAGVFAQ